MCTGPLTNIALLLSLYPEMVCILEVGVVDGWYLGGGGFLPLYPPPPKMVCVLEVDRGEWGSVPITELVRMLEGGGGGRGGGGAVPVPELAYMLEGGGGGGEGGGGSVLVPEHGHARGSGSTRGGEGCGWLM